MQLQVTRTAVIALMQGIEAEYAAIDWNNESEEVVLNATYVSAYKGTLVIKVPGEASMSFGIMFIGNDVNIDNVVYIRVNSFCHKSRTNYRRDIDALLEHRFFQAYSYINEYYLVAIGYPMFYINAY